MYNYKTYSLKQSGFNLYPAICSKSWLLFTLPTGTVINTVLLTHPYHYHPFYDKQSTNTLPADMLTAQHLSSLQP